MFGQHKTIGPRAEEERQKVVFRKEQAVIKQVKCFWSRMKKSNAVGELLSEKQVTRKMNKQNQEHHAFSKQHDVIKEVMHFRARLKKSHADCEMVSMHQIQKI